MTDGGIQVGRQRPLARGTCAEQRRAVRVTDDLLARWPLHTRAGCGRPVHSGRIQADFCDNNTLPLEWLDTSVRGCASELAQALEPAVCDTLAL